MEPPLLFSLRSQNFSQEVARHKGPNAHRTRCSCRKGEVHFIKSTCCPLHSRPFLLVGNSARPFQPRVGSDNARCNLRASASLGLRRSVRSGTAKICFKSFVSEFDAAGLARHDACSLRLHDRTPRKSHLYGAVSELADHCSNTIVIRVWGRHTNIKARTMCFSPPPLIHL